MASGGWPPAVLGHWFLVWDTAAVKVSIQVRPCTGLHAGLSPTREPQLAMRKRTLSALDATAEGVRGRATKVLVFVPPMVVVRPVDSRVAWTRTEPLTTPTWARSILMPASQLGSLAGTPTRRVAHWAAAGRVTVAVPL